MLHGFKYMPSSVPSSSGVQPACSSDCTRYRGTVDVFYKVVKQVSEAVLGANNLHLYICKKKKKKKKRIFSIHNSVSCSFKLILVYLCVLQSVFTFKTCSRFLLV